ncbi:MAG: hypothetical protein ACO1PB_19735 [Ramlibacter sp.]
MNHDHDPGWPAFPGAPMRRAMARSLAALVLTAALLLGLGVHGFVYLALEGGRPSVDLVLQGAPRALCAWLHACSP